MWVHHRRGHPEKCITYSHPCQVQAAVKAKNPIQVGSGIKLELGMKGQIELIDTICNSWRQRKVPPI